MTRTEQIVLLAAEGLTAKEAGERMGVTAHAAQTYADRAGVRLCKEGERTVQRVAACYAEGLTGMETAHRLGIDRTTVQKAAKVLGLSFQVNKLARSARLRAEVAERERAEAARLKAEEDAALMQRWRDAQAARRAAQADPVAIVLDHIARKGRISEPTVLRMDEAVLGAAMARVAPAVRRAA